MLLRSGSPVDFWWDAYEASNYITNRLPTKTSCGYQTTPKTYIRKDWREKYTSGYLMGYSVDGVMGYKIYIPELKKVVIGVNCLFNEVIPTYRKTIATKSVK